MTSLQVRDGVYVLHLGDDGNHVRESFLDGLTGALDAIHEDADAEALVVTAAGKSFSQGYDLEHLAALAADDAGAGGAFVQRSIDVLARVLIAPVPTAAAITGHAFGYGALLALACDLRVQRADRGWWCLPEVDLGLRFQPMQLALVQAKLTPAAAEEATLAGRRWDAAAALAAGVVHAVAPEGEEVARAIELLAPRRGKGRTILQGMKRDLYADVLAQQHAKVPT